MRDPIRLFLWKDPVYILSVGDALTHDDTISFVDGDADSVIPDPNLIFTWKSGHTLQIT